MTEIVSPIDTAAAQALEVFSPTTGQRIGVHAIATADDVTAAVALARVGAAWWAGLPHKRRRSYLLTWRSVLTRRIGQLAQLVSDETGRRTGDCEFEIALAIEHIAWAANNAESTLKRRRVGPGLMLFNQTATVEYLPLGVIGVIGPWNFPVFTPVGSIAYALAAGNTVVFKPSELTPAVGVWLARTFADVVGRQDILQAIIGRAEAGDALCRSKIDKLAFTGSAATGKSVMKACADRLTPVVIEAGGKDAMLIDEDANIAAAVDAAVWGSFANTGQACIAIERIYVHDKVFDQFVEAFVNKARNLRAGADEAADLGPVTLPSQLDVIKRHVDDALTAGGTVVVGGPHSVGRPFVQPVAITHVPESSLAITEETFGPTVVINPVASMNEAISNANASDCGLGSAVFTRRRGAALARRLHTGMTSINSVLTFGGMGALPFGGVKQSGFGRVHGPDGLREFSYAKAVTSQNFRPLMNLTSFARGAATEKNLKTFLQLRHGRKSVVPTQPLLQKRR